MARERDRGSVEKRGPSRESTVLTVFFGVVRLAVLVLAEVLVVDFSADFLPTKFS